MSGSVGLRPSPPTYTQTHIPLARRCVVMQNLSSYSTGQLLPLSVPLCCQVGQGKEQEYCKIIGKWG